MNHLNRILAYLESAAAKELDSLAHVCALVECSSISYIGTSLVFSSKEQPHADTEAATPRLKLWIVQLLESFFSDDRARRTSVYDVVFDEVNALFHPGDYTCAALHSRSNGYLIRIDRELLGPRALAAIRAVIEAGDYNDAPVILSVVGQR